MFSKYIEIGSEIKRGVPMKQRHVPVSDNQIAMAIKIFTSTEKSPKYVTDPSCHPLGVLTVPLPVAAKGQTRQVTGSMYFGETELMFEAMDKSTGKVYKTKFDCL